MFARLLPAVLVLVLVTGCLSEKVSPSPPEQPPSTTSSRTSDPTDISIPPSTGNVSQAIVLDGCEKGIIAVIYAPQPLYPNAVPPNAAWAADNPLLVMRVRIEECARMSVGPFERGPVHLLLEMHDNLNAPASCREIPGDYTSDETLSQLWLDDAEIVEYLQATYALPIRFASFNVAQDNVGTVTRDQWSFGVPGEPTSTLEGMIGGTDATSFPVYRLYYAPTEGRIAFMDFAVHLDYEGLGDTLTTGKLAPPLLYASAGPGDLVAYGSPSRNGYFSGEVRQFGDDQCKEPL